MELVFSLRGNNDAKSDILVADLHLQQDSQPYRTLVKIQACANTRNRIGERIVANAL
jgi:hypothetical protein